MLGEPLAGASALNLLWAVPELGSQLAPGALLSPGLRGNQFCWHLLVASNPGSSLWWVHLVGSSYQEAFQLPQGPGACRGECARIDSKMCPSLGDDSHSELLFPPCAEKCRFYKSDACVVL